MQKLKILADFKFAHRGVEIAEYTKGSEIETGDADLVEVAVREKWAKKLGASETSQPAAADPAADPATAGA